VVAVARQHLHAALEHVGKRQVGDVNVSVVETHACTDGAGGVGDDVAVAEHRAFGVARGAAGEADGGEHVGLGGAERSRAGFAGSCNVVHGHYVEVWVGLLGGVVDRAHDDDVLEGAADDGQRDLQLGGTAHHRGEVGVLDDKLHGVVAEGVVQGHGGDGLAVGALLRKHPVGAVLREEADHGIALHLVQVFDGLVSRNSKSQLHNSFADIHGFRVRVAVVHPPVRASTTDAAAGGLVTPTEAVARASVDVSAVLEVVIESLKAGRDAITEAIGCVGVAIRRAAGGGGLEVRGFDGVVELRG